MDYLRRGVDIMSAVQMAVLGCFTKNPPPTVELLLIAAGGGAASGSTNYVGGGAGAGEVIQSLSYAITQGVLMTVLIGAGGAPNGGKGSDSSFGSLVAWGGGGQWTQTNTGSGCGNDNYHSGIGVGTHGYNGGNTVGFSTASAGGGGAASAGVGQTLNGYGTEGGLGIESAITGTPTKYAGGGNGSGSVADGHRTEWGGGDAPGGSAPANLGGGGGASYGYGNGGAGGSGKFVIRYPDTYDTLPVSTGATYTKAGGFHIYVWNATGAFMA